MQRYRRELLQRLAAVLELEPTQADGVRLRKRYRKVREQLLVFMSNREVLTTKNLSAQALRLSTIFRKVTNGWVGCGVVRRSTDGRGHGPPGGSRRWLR